LRPLPLRFVAMCRQDGTLCFDLPFGWLLVWLDSVTGLAELGLHGLVLSPASLAAFVSRLFVNWFMFDGAIWRKGDRASPLLQTSSPTFYCQVPLTNTSGHRPPVRAQSKGRAAG